MLAISRQRRARGRRGQSEVIGGLIVLTVIFMLALPVILNSFQSAEWSTSQAKSVISRQRLAYNEKIEVGGLSPTSVLATRVGLAPAVWVNNTGTVEVTLRYMYLIDIYNNTIYRVIDLANARPGNPPLIVGMYKNVGSEGPISQNMGIPPKGEPITLGPGETLLIAFNKSLLPLAPFIAVKVSTDSGLLYPITGGGNFQTLSTLRGGEKGEGGLSGWRGAFIPVSGFYLKGYSDLRNSGDIKLWKPPILVRTVSDKGNPKAVRHSQSFIYDDPDYPGLYEIRILVSSEGKKLDPKKLTYLSWKVLDQSYPYAPIESGDPIPLYPGQVLVIKGFLGTYYTTPDIVKGKTVKGYTYISGYAHEIHLFTSIQEYKEWKEWKEKHKEHHHPQPPPAQNFTKVVDYEIPLDPYISNSIAEADIDNNGVDELVFYSLSTSIDYPFSRDLTDADIDTLLSGDKDNITDSLAWTYIVTRDVSSVDYIKVSLKINYFWNITLYNKTQNNAGGEGDKKDKEGGSNAYGCPTDYEKLRIFAIAVWKYNSTGRNWYLYQYKSFYFDENRPLGMQASALFPVDRSGIYRVGVIFYDNYRDFEFSLEKEGEQLLYNCFIDFTYSLEHIVVEYGILNPLFKETPPVYIVAINDSTLISGIGEEDYASMHNITDINQAKILAQQELLESIVNEFEYAGIVSYTLINTSQKLCDLLFNEQQITPPRYAVVIWLQGSVSIEDVTRGVCSVIPGMDRITDDVLKDFIDRYNWTWVWAFGVPFGNAGQIPVYNQYVDATPAPGGGLELPITSSGISVRKEAYAFYLYNSLLFLYGVTFQDESYRIVPATFYGGSINGTTYYGTVAFFLDTGHGVVVLNPVNVDWDFSGDGAIPETIAQQIVYSALKAVEALKSQ